MARCSVAKPARLHRIGTATAFAALAFGCEVLPPASAEAERCGSAVGLHLGLQRPVAIRSETPDGPRILKIEFEGLNGENIPVQGHAECAFAAGDEAVRALAAVHVDGVPLPTAEVEVLDKTLERRGK